MEEDGYELFHTAHMSVTERLIACLKNGTMTDVALVGDDGIPVPAARYILGSASAVFQPLLYGNFRTTESNSDTVNIPESNQKNLTALVEFCCSDRLNTSIWADSGPLEIVQDTVALANLAHTYEVPLLQIQIRDFLHPLMLAYPPLACAVFNVADPVSTPDVFLAAQVILQEKAYQALKTASKDKSPVGGMICLTPNKLEDVLADAEVEADELFLFQQLVEWRDHNDAKYDNANAICKDMVQHLDLSLIDPNEIETTVLNSGFVTAAMVVKAVLAQAKTASHEGLAFAAIRGPRGKKYANVLVRGAGDPACDGVYVNVNREKVIASSGTSTPTQKSRNMVFFIKKPTNGNPHHPPPRTYILVQDSAGNWRICDSIRNVLYEWQPGRTAEKFPYNGWVAVSGSLPAPECSLQRAPHQSPSIASTSPSSASRSSAASFTPVKDPSHHSSTESRPRLFDAPPPKQFGDAAKEDEEPLPSSPPRPPTIGRLAVANMVLKSHAVSPETENPWRVKDDKPAETEKPWRVEDKTGEAEKPRRVEEVRNIPVLKEPVKVETVKVETVTEEKEALEDPGKKALMGKLDKEKRKTVQVETVTEEKKEATEDTTEKELKEKQQAEKRKVIRTSALFDEENDDLAASLAPADPIIGIAVGGDGFLAADAAEQRKPELDKLTEQTKKGSITIKPPTAPAENKQQTSAVANAKTSLQKALSTTKTKPRYPTPRGSNRYSQSKYLEVGDSELVVGCADAVTAPCK